MSRPRPRVRGTRRQLEAAVPGQRAAQAVGSVRICRATAGTTLAVSLPPPGTLTSIVNRDWRATRVARWLWCAPASKSPSQWPGTARSATSAVKFVDDTDYALGRTKTEYERLVAQAESMRPLTERTLRAAGIALACAFSISAAGWGREFPRGGSRRSSRVGGRSRS